MRPIVILGVGGFGREVHELIEDINDALPSYSIVGFLDGNVEKQGTEVHGLPVLGDIDWLEQHPGTAVVIGVGSPAIKRKLSIQLRRYSPTFPALIHPRALIGRRVQIGEGSVLGAGTIATTDLRMGSFVTVNINATIGHDVVLDDFVTLAPGAHISGHVHVGEGADIGTGAALIQGVAVGPWSIVGASASVVRSLPSNVTAVGVPAKVIKEREPGWQL